MEKDNEIRLLASDAIIQLYNSKNVSQLKLLKMIVDQSLKELENLNYCKCGYNLYDIESVYGFPTTKICRNCKKELD